MPDGGDFPCCAPGRDPYVFGPEVSDEGQAAAAGYLEAEARALGRAYRAHGDQLAAAEAEAVADQHQADRHQLTAGEWSRSIRRFLGLGP
jgi:hypothetical protein